MKIKKTGNVRFLSPTARTKIAANLAMKGISECVAIDATMEKSFNKDDYMTNLIEQAKWLKAGEGGKCKCHRKHKCHCKL